MCIFIYMRVYTTINIYIYNRDDPCEVKLGFIELANPW